MIEAVRCVAGHLVKQMEIWIASYLISMLYGVRISLSTIIRVVLFEAVSQSLAF